MDLMLVGYNDIEGLDKSQVPDSMVDFAKRLLFESDLTGFQEKLRQFNLSFNEGRCDSDCKRTWITISFEGNIRLFVIDDDVYKADYDNNSDKLKLNAAGLHFLSIYEEKRYCYSINFQVSDSRENQKILIEGLLNNSVYSEVESLRMTS